MRGTVSIVLPAGTQLPVTLSLLVPVQQEIPIELDVEVYIPLVETELAQPFQNLQNLFAPLVNGLNNLPGRWADVPTFTIKTINGEYSGDNNLLRDTEGRQNAWDCSVWNGRECQADELAQ
ncbi:MAG: hypothetical protein HC923_02610, partial [Myxococcales bacterium]|nr:hypothetical protein [Myxococcales bacterium]